MGKEQEPVQSVGRTEVAKLQYPLMHSVQGLMIYCAGQSVQRSGVLTIYKTHPVGNFRHKHRTLKFDVAGEGFAIKYIYIS